MSHHIIKDLVMPYSSTLILSKEEFAYNINLYELYIKLNASDSAVDLKINQGNMIGLGSGTSSGAY